MAARPLAAAAGVAAAGAEPDRRTTVVNVLMKILRSLRRRAQRGEPRVHVHGSNCPSNGTELELRCSLEVERQASFVLLASLFR